MSIEAGLFQLLSQSAALQALVGNPAAFVFPVMLPEKPPLPCISYQLVGGSANPALTRSGVQRRRYQFDFWADYEQGTYDQAIALRDAVIHLLNGFTGALPNGFYVTSILYHQSLDGFENDARQYRCTAEFYITYNLPA
ncbi:DUF3168 domain-containing protein [Granulicella sp. 5B5]|uniref:DUF3168 domain-containing protein n=1 Tax=Granulicella sp. 5B5 TaxID=1617967 RepID=UPI0015F5E0FD|nr:DUF3168 domain-containing protein [Granulicella sp. 5B5]QMV19691.1 DUF3168 domain-containing protein [Granulicella sp. 5B5]